MQKGKATVMTQWYKQLQLYVHRVVGALRVADIFDIVTSYPDSAAAVQDLHDCLSACSLQKSLVKTYRHACATRLHIAGDCLAVSAVLRHAIFRFGVQAE